MNSSHLLKRVSGCSLLLCALLGAKICGQDNASYRPGDYPGPPAGIRDYNETILQVDLQTELGFTGRLLRMHYSATSAGGAIPQHSHADRPTIEYFLHGNATETVKGEDGRVRVKLLRENTTELSTIGISHWWKNDTRGMTKIMAVDIWKGSGTIVDRPVGNPRTSPLTPPVHPGGFKIEDMGSLDLATQLPLIPAASSYILRSRRFTLLPGQATPLSKGDGNPSIMVVVRGDVWENRSDEDSSIRRTGEYSVATKGISYFWENPTVDPVVLWIVDIVKKDAS